LQIVTLLLTSLHLLINAQFNVKKAFHDSLDRTETDTYETAQ